MGNKRKEKISQKSTSYPHPLPSACAELISKKPFGMSRNFLRKNGEVWQNLPILLLFYGQTLACPIPKTRSKDLIDRRGKHQNRPNKTPRTKNHLFKKKTSPCRSKYCPIPPHRNNGNQEKNSRKTLTTGINTP